MIEISEQINSETVARTFRISGRAEMADVIVDVEDADLLKMNWTVAAPRNGQKPYAKRRVYSEGRRSTVALHRLIMRAGAGEIVDHINRNTLDNRRLNLRLTDRCGNAQNRPNRGGSTGFRGVYPAAHGQGFCARIGCRRQYQNLGTHKTAIDAARAYDVAARQLHGDFAVLNNV